MSLFPSVSSSIWTSRQINQNQIDFLLASTDVEIIPFIIDCLNEHILDPSLLLVHSSLYHCHKPFIYLSLRHGGNPSIRIRSMSNKNVYELKDLLSLIKSPSESIVCQPPSTPEDRIFLDQVIDPSQVKDELLPSLLELSIRYFSMSSFKLLLSHVVSLGNIYLLSLIISWSIIYVNKHSFKMIIDSIQPSMMCALRYFHLDALADRYNRSNEYSRPHYLQMINTCLSAGIVFNDDQLTLKSEVDISKLPSSDDSNEHKIDQIVYHDGQKTWTFDPSTFESLLSTKTNPHTNDPLPDQLIASLRARRNTAKRLGLLSSVSAIDRSGYLPVMSISCQQHAQTTIDAILKLYDIDVNTISQDQWKKLGQLIIFPSDIISPVKQLKTIKITIYEHFNIDPSSRHKILSYLK